MWLDGCYIHTAYNYKSIMPELSWPSHKVIEALCVSSHSYVEILANTVVQPSMVQGRQVSLCNFRARSQIPVVGVTGHAPGWPGASKLPGAAV